MKKGIFYASETGNTKNHAYDIGNCFSKNGIEFGDPTDIVDLNPKELKEYDFLIFGSPTWNIGELQADLAAIMGDLEKIDFSNRVVAIYGCGDQEGYPDTYQDAIGILANLLMNQNATLIGQMDTNGHNFTASKALLHGKFLGLALDNHNQEELSLPRIEEWVKKLINEFKNLAK